MADKEIGKVIHYYGKAMVAVVKLSGDVKVGDEVKFVHQDNEFTEKIESIEVDHKRIKSAKKGDEVAVKVNQKTHEHAAVYKVV